MGVEELLTVGRAVKAHGLAGEISVAVEVPLPPEELVGVNVWIVPPVLGAVPRRVEAVRPGPKGPLLKLSGIDTIESAQQVAGRNLKARASDLPPECSQSVFDPIGMAVIDVERGELGRVVELIVTGANDVWVVDSPRFGEVLLPDIDEVVLEVDEVSRTVSVRLLPGLIDEEG